MYLEQLVHQPNRSETIIGSPTASPPSVISNNGKHGIFSIASDLEMYGAVHVGVALDGVTPAPNSEDGVYIESFGKHTTIAAGLVASGNAGRGLYIGADFVTVVGAYVGVDATGTKQVGNGGDGIFVAESAHSVEIVDGIASGNGRSGIMMEGQRATVDGMLVGMAKDGSSVLSNGRYGIEVGNYGTNLNIGSTAPTTISGNTLGDVLTSAPNTWLCNVRIGITASMDEAVATRNASSSTTGVIVQPSAIDAIIGKKSATATSRVTSCTAIIKGYGGYGIDAAAPGLTIESASVLNNSHGGIYLQPTATNAAITDSTIASNGAANDGAGVRTTALNTLIRGCTIGQSMSSFAADPNQHEAGNKGAGIHIEAEATGFEIDNSTYIAANGLINIRDDESAADWRRAPVTTSAGILGNGWARDACTLCTCNPNEEHTGIVVDCRKQDGESARDLGPSFPTNIPSNTTEIRLSGVNLHNIDWDELHKGGASLKVFDVADNPLLNPLPQVAFARYVPFNGTLLPALQVFGLSGTILAELEDNTFQSIDRELVTTIDLSSPSEPPAPTVAVNLTGFSAPLSAIQWYENSRCPSGFYASTALPAKEDSAMCVRCPVGTFKPGSGGFLDACVACTDIESGTVDNDSDPTTPCIHPFTFIVNVDDETRNHFVNSETDKQQFDASYTDPNHTTVYVSGIGYKIAPHPLIKDGTTVSDGHFDDITFRLSSDAPKEFFVQANTGDIFGKFPSVKSTGNDTYTFDLNAVDAAGKLARVERYTFAVKDPAEFNLATTTQRRFSNTDGKYTNPANNTNVYEVGATYLINPLAVTEGTTVSAGTLDEISFTFSQSFSRTHVTEQQPTSIRGGSVNGQTPLLQQDLPLQVPEFFISANNGIMSLRFQDTGTYVFNMYAVDSEGEQELMEKMTFNVENASAFEVTSFDHVPEDDATADYSYEYTNSSDEPSKVYSVGDTYRLAPIKILAANHFHVPPGANGANLSDVSITFTTTNAPPGFLIDPASGFVQGTPTRVGNYTMSLYAVDAAGERTLHPIETILFDIRSGPGNQGCLNQGVIVVDLAISHAFTCDCSETNFEGANCEKDPELAAAAASQAKAQQTTVSIGASAGGVIVLILLIIGAVKYHQYKESMKPVDFDTQFALMVSMGLIEPEQAKVQMKPHEIRRKDLTLVKVIGSGAFGEVYKAQLDEMFTRSTPEYTVAAKTVLDAKSSPEATKEMLAEAGVMAAVGSHPNLVSLIGIITRGDPLILILQFCAQGELLGMLKKAAAEGEPISLMDKMQFAREVAQGMDHLSKKHFIHRDLACRNVLCAEGMCKIADFGLSRGAGGQSSTAENDDIATHEDYYKSTAGVFPVRWTAPEAMETLRFTPASDVWSFGIVVWCSFFV
jgi:hypothetical protein